jgi:uncharacterized protein YbaR (Trm112 family)/SAM-dependent methyltransferase
MSDADRLQEILACPRCDHAPLEASQSGLRCNGCKTRFPSIAGIPWLFAEPDAALGEWRNRLHFDLQRLSHNSQRLKAELDEGKQLPQTEKRLTLLLQATDQHRQDLQQLLAPVDVQSMHAGYHTHLALRTRLPRDQGLQTYYANVHRDWSWGDDENASSLNEIGQVLREGNRGEKPGHTLVLGGGAGRLAYDIHMSLCALSTVVMDFNPLLLLVADAVTRGKRLRLHEFPIAPRTADDVAVLRQLAAPAPVREGFFLVLGDALRAPFRPGSFDTVVTPWLIDIVTEDLPVLAARINRLLKDGGRWINFGSLAFDHLSYARRYGPEETSEIVARAGFARPAVREETIPYMCSPASRHGRQERVFTFAAAKTADASQPPRHRSLPDWIVTGTEAVPSTPSFQNQALSTRIYSYVMSLIDGRRSIEDMALIMEQQKLMSRSEAVPAIRNFLTRMYDDSQRQA